MPGRMHGKRADVEAPGFDAVPVRVRDLVGYGALVLAPHPDDEVLGCGGLIAAIPEPKIVEVLVLSDGALSPPAAAGRPELPPARREESLRALARLGVERDHVSFLELPDGRLAEHGEDIDRAVLDAVTRNSVTDVFIPFRFDRHPDHRAAHAAGERLLRKTGIRLWEYFVYPFWRLLPRGDVRRLVKAGTLYGLGLTPEVRAAKRDALNEYRSQTSGYPDGEGRPVLSDRFLDRICAGPEAFLRYEVVRPGTKVLRRGGAWFRVVRRVEPPIKRALDALRDRRTGG